MFRFLWLSLFLRWTFAPKYSNGFNLYNKTDPTKNEDRTKCFWFIMMLMIFPFCGGGSHCKLLHFSSFHWDQIFLMVGTFGWWVAGVDSSPSDCNHCSSFVPLCSGVQIVQLLMTLTPAKFFHSMLNSRSRELWMYARLYPAEPVCPYSCTYTSKTK